ncbi:MAG: NADH-quinone oxidoreductase subunit L [Verrucomicrobia bacterium]|nr:MAG: NADH-quinone oxidoreductase subunit L [Verrucomicrobiota bacterium]
MSKTPWLILLAPLVSAALITLVTRPARRLSAFISVVAVLLSFFCSCIVFARPEISALEIPWIEFHGILRVPIGFILDPLSKTMLVLVSGVGALIHIYSLGYMRDDPGKSRYFASLSLFMFSMLGIVLANNFVMMFVFWELVGLCSYLLIGHWFERDSAADAAKKAFITNRIGDFGFMLGILLVWGATGSVVFDEIVPQLWRVTSNPTFLTICVLLIFCGAVGKSAQFPLHVWLPDAMEGPTPISALIHAATMVAAGVYMLVRVGFLVQASPVALAVIAWIGTITAVMAALIAIQQDDIKRILAYSTLSQLGYMVMAVGLASGEAAMFHLFTHAFFKALLFLGAGSVLVALHHEQNIWKMGGQGRNLFLTFVTFGIGMLALIGCPPFAGFFSKDAILSLAYNRNPAIFGLALFTAFLTAFYMMRLFVVVFFGKPRSPAAKTSRESPTSMLVPLAVLALLSLLGGFNFFATHFLTLPHERDVGDVAAFVPGVALVAMLLGVAGAIILYRSRIEEPLSINLLRRKFYFDELYRALINATQEFLARVSGFIDRWIIDATVVRGSSGATWSFGALLRLMQVGNLQAYAFIFGLGIIWIIYFAIFR